MRELLRVVGAGVTIFAAMAAGVFVAGSFFPKGPGWAWGLVMVPLVGGALVLSYWFFNPKGAFFSPRKLRAEGLAISESFRSTRAFQVAEYGDEGPHYFLELQDGRVLYLNGQYIIAYEPCVDEEEGINESRRFPCTQFTVWRHKTEGYVVEIECRGEPFEPELVTPHFSREDMRRDNLPKDGAILADKTYEQLKAERLAAQ